ncbi:helix-turn-helix domain-containing protein [Halobacterium rubrum]|uniref:helix-turn-helix domain-containing protein n=1 Tax=Halobacterium TaxID=2239 RepID=UPI001F1AA2D4|nr:MULTISPECIES: helix-turn-helix domain-containing protein [Halobacterium]MDH5021138.1 helix-turn-helix domain-containing protein [Halobacterium rubrum]
MVQASLTLTVPEQTWIGTVSRQYPDARFQVRSAQSCDGLGVGFVELYADDPTRICEDITGYEDVHAVEVFHEDDDRAVVQIEADAPILLRVLDRTGVPVEMPFEIADGEVDWEVTTTRNRLSDLAAELDRSEVGYMVEHIRDETSFDAVLTDRQQEVLNAAIDAGYYDSPRECTQEELAAELEMAKSTCSEILHRAEERVVKQFTDGDQPAFTDRVLSA